MRPYLSIALALLIAAAVLGAPTAPPAQASPQSYTVDRGDDVVAIACTGAVNDCSLRGAVQNANANPGSTIVLSAQQTYTLTNTVAGELILTATTTITTDLGICSLNCSAVIRGGPGWPYRLLQVQAGATVTVDNVEFTHGHDANGGALQNFGTLTLTDSQIFSNTSLGWGGGVLNYGTLTLSNTVVNGNQALSNGGAITNQADVDRPGTVALYNSQIVTNSVTGPLVGQGLGGGLTSFTNVSGTIQPVVTMVNSRVLSNTGTITGFGGGLFLDGQTTLTNVTLQGNSAAGGGGAYVHFGVLTMQGGSVASNIALTSGGSGGGFRNDGQLTLNGVLVTGNQAQAGGGGGAISSSSPFTLTDSTFIHNHAEGSGGVILLAGPSARVLLDHDTLLSNDAEFGGGLAGYGTATVTNNTHINGNTAFQGAGLNIFGGGGALITGGSQIDDNDTSGGALGTSYGAGIFNAGTLTLTTATLDGNLASNGGGAGLYNAATGLASLTGADLVNNQAQAGPGGGVANLGALTITASTLVSNTSLTSGGAISNTGTLNLLNVTLSNNTAITSAGGLYNTGLAHLNFVTLADNTAPVNSDLVTTGTLTTSLTLANSLLGGDAGSPDCFGQVTSSGYNLIADTDGCTLTGPGTGDKRNLDPKITPLVDQGGLLRFHDLQDHSPALNAADPAGGACPAADQRGVARPIGPRCDIGAIESAAQGFYYLLMPLLHR